MMNLMKIKLENRELDENQKMMNENLIKISHTIITWVSISQASADMQENFPSVWQISKTITWKSESWTWSNDESRDRELDENQTIWIKSLKKRAL
jgi:hypothetical protein